MKIKKGLALILAMCSMATIASCGRPSNGGGSGNVYNVESPTKTKLQVIHFDGGVGHLWLDQAAERFAKEYKVDLDLYHGSLTKEFIAIISSSESDSWL